MTDVRGFPEIRYASRPHPPIPECIVSLAPACTDFLRYGGWFRYCLVSGLLMRCLRRWLFKGIAAPYWLLDGVVLTNNKDVHAAKAGEFGLMSILMLHTHVPAIVTTEQLDAILPRADFLLAATPDTPESRGLLDRRRLDLMKPSAGLVNIGRETVMDYDALCDKLEDGSLAGAILDVFQTEPIAASSRLWNTRNLIITPHVSADDGDAYVPMTINLFLRNMELHLAGKPLLNPVRPELGY